MVNAKPSIERAYEFSNPEGIRIFDAHHGLHGYGDAYRRNEVSRYYCLLSLAFVAACFYQSLLATLPYIL